jgi:hypothetical protein
MIFWGENNILFSFVLLVFLVYFSWCDSFAAEITVVSVTTGVSECAGSTPRPLAVGERLLVSPRSDDLVTQIVFSCYNAVFFGFSVISFSSKKL